MEWLRRTSGKRVDPRRVLPGARSILVGTVRYGPQRAPEGEALSGRVSAYAWGDDYHSVVGAKAAGLARFVRLAHGARAVEYVDTGPVLERMWAARAGVGWIGKNAMVLNKDHGSWIFLAVVLTDLELPPDQPAPDQCGSCTLCMEACPTGAIVEPRVVDSRLCLSYHTIELRGSFPPRHREPLGDRAFGCDDCQTSCPWNEGEFEPPAAFRPRIENGAPDLPGLASMALREYTARFRGSSMKRATYHGLRRNAAVALGNLLAGRRGRESAAAEPSPAERSRAREALAALAGDPEISVAEAARWALRQAGGDPSGSDPQSSGGTGSLDPSRVDR